MNPPVDGRACLHSGCRAVIGCDCCSPSNVSRAGATLQIEGGRRRRQGREFTVVQNLAARAGRKRQVGVVVNKERQHGCLETVYVEINSTASER